MIALEYSLPFSNLSWEQSLHPVSIGSYVSCLYEKRWYDGINEEVSVDKKDVLIKSLHPVDLSGYLNWPEIDIKCWVLVNHILQLLSIPTVNT